MKLFKSLLFITLLTLSIHGTAQTSSVFVSQADSIRITGRVIGFDPAEKENFINFTTYGLDGDSNKQAVQLRPDGSFNVSLYQSFAGDIQVNYKDAYKKILAGPGEPLVLEITNSKLLNNTGFKDAIVVKGRLAQVNTQLLNFQTDFSLHQFQYKADIGDKTQSDSAFTSNRMKQLDEEFAFLNAFVKRQQITDSTFFNWQKNQMLYAAANEVLIFPFFGKYNKTITPEVLMNYIKQIKVDNPAALANSSYYEFLSSLSSGQQIIININPAYEALKKQNGYNAIPLYLDKIDSVSSGIARQLLYLNVYRPQYNVSGFNAVAGRYQQVITEGYLKELYKQREIVALNGFAKYSVTGKLKASPAGADLKKRLLALFEQEKGNNLYLDFWGDWCGPCMMEMPNYPKLITAFNNKPIKFIFMAVGTSEKSMAEIKNKYHIEADFINLTKDEAAIMNNVFGFHSYPSHFLVDSKGMVASNRLGGVSNAGSVEVLKTSITKLLML